MLGRAARPICQDFVCSLSSQRLGSELGFVLGAKGFVAALAALLQRCFGACNGCGDAFVCAGPASPAFHDGPARACGGASLYRPRRGRRFPRCDVALHERLQRAHRRPSHERSRTAVGASAVWAGLRGSCRLGLTLSVVFFAVGSPVIVRELPTGFSGSAAARSAAGAGSAAGSAVGVVGVGAAAGVGADAGAAGAAGSLVCSGTPGSEDCSWSHALSARNTIAMQLALNMVGLVEKARTDLTPPCSEHQEAL